MAKVVIYYIIIKFISVHIRPTLEKNEYDLKRPYESLS